ncbi:hypothetical protein VB796_20780 [Arcicella sp. LKC2W]|uniref:hypothetical protein n=1 Tax=Arcicella sp. LKC2W TaxID=2984198 RepID=UPI002B1F4F22|nr:hypothetical protein [Arcicella sp. LKC2W]MEA5461514.1 hypothetical protein [Arcicella sp. LKC2W]
MSSRTIKNDGKFADGMSKFSESLRKEVLQGVSEISSKDIQALVNEEIDKDSIDSIDNLSSVIDKAKPSYYQLKNPNFYSK